MIGNFWVGMFKNGRSHSGDGTLILTVFEELRDKITDFMHVDADSQKLKADKNILWSEWSKASVVSLVTGI